MVDSAALTAAFAALRDSLAALADRADDRLRAITLRQRALVAGELAEQCGARFPSGQVPGGDHALAGAQRAARLADAAGSGDASAIDAAADAAAQASTALNGIVRGGARGGGFADRFRGSLRVSSPTRAAGGLADAAEAKDEPAYAASVAMLFPAEAVTLFPLGRSIAGTNGAALAVVIGLIAAFVVVVRYFATQERNGRPAYGEIAIATISFLLWVGSLQGFWMAGGPIDVGIDADLGAKMFGFATIMWVALVPYLVRRHAPSPQP